MLYYDCDKDSSTKQKKYLQDPAQFHYDPHHDTIVV